MNHDKRQLKQINEENYIWIIYYFIVTFALIANVFEKKYILSKDTNNKKITQIITTTILVVAFFIYLYFTIISKDNLDYFKQTGNQKEIKIATERLIANILFLIAGFVALYADYDSNSTNVDLAILSVAWSV